jgi:hypothetical protein
VYASTNPESSSVGKQYFTSYIRVTDQATTSTTSTTIDPNSMTENNKYEELEFTKFVDEYKEFKNIFLAEECLNKCTADIRCRAVTLFHSDRVPYFYLSWDDGLARE